MAAGKNKMKRKCSLELRETKTWKTVKFIFSGSSYQSSDTTTSAGVKGKCNYNDAKEEKAPLDKLKGSEKEHEGEVIQNCTALASQTEMNHRISDQRGCVEPTSTSEQSKSLSYITREALKYQASELKRKIKKMNHKLQKYAAMCMELNDDNKLIMVELRQMCQPYVIQMLEATNPYKNP